MGFFFFYEKKSVSVLKFDEPKLPCWAVEGKTSGALKNPPLLPQNLKALLFGCHV